MMSAFNKKKVFDCLRDACVVEDQSCRDADEVVACDGFELRLNNLMDGRVRLSDDRGVQAHADDCLECRGVLQQYQQLELLFGVEGEQRVCLRDESVEVSGLVGSRMGLKQGLAWAKLPLTIVALVALMVIFAGQGFNGSGNGEAAPSVAVAEIDSQKLLGGEVMSSSEMASSEAVVSDLFWAAKSPVSHLKGWVDSGSELLAAGEEQAAVIRELSNVRLDLEGLESRLESLQPMLTYSGRIPALSPMQGTVCFTLGWLKKDKAADLQEPVKSAVEVGQWRLHELRFVV